MRRNWIKLYVDQILRGSMMDELTPAQRWIWIGLLLLAGDSAYEGQVSVTKRKGYTSDQLADLLDVPASLMEKALLVMEQVDKIKRSKAGIIRIQNWKKYQSDYQRQKKHRQKEFTEIRSQIKERDDFTCQECDKHKDDLKVPLCIHHIDNDPENNEPENLILLCMSCHSKLLKKGVHKTKSKAIGEKAEKFKEKVQVKSSGQKFSLDIERDKEEELEKDIRKERKKPESMRNELKIIFNRYLKKGEVSEEEIALEFNNLWDIWPRSENKKAAFVAYKALRKKVGKNFIMACVSGYAQYLKHKRTNEDFEQTPMYLSTFLGKERWLEYFGFEYKARL